MHNSPLCYYFKTKKKLIEECRLTFKMILKLWDMGFIKKLKHSIKDFDHKYFAVSNSLNF